MKKPVHLILSLCAAVLLHFSPYTLFAQGEESTDSLYDAVDIQLLMEYDSIQASLTFQDGVIKVNDVAKLNIPEGYKFIPRDQARMIVEDLWKNPKDESILGMVVKSDYNLLAPESWAFIVSYEESGYVKDEDADDIDYDQMLKDIQESEEEINKQRIKEGYVSIHIADWATKPYYDHDRKILHWAKKIKFGDEPLPDEYYTLNYDVRFLGRKGVLSMNAVGTMNQLDDINTHIPDMLSCAVFEEGNTYADFNPSVDKVAAYTIGGLIAGKLLAKTGLLVLLLKNIKLILLAVAGFFGAFRKKIAAFFGRKKQEETPVAIRPHGHLYNGDEPTDANNDTSESTQPEDEGPTQKNDA